LAKIVKMTVDEFNFLFHHSEQENVILTFLVKLHTLITKLNHIINGIKKSASSVFLVAYKINSEINLM
jgi:hypothetical protein